MSLPLTGPLPEKVEAAGELLSIRTDFRVGIRFALLMEDGEIPSLQKLALMLRMYYPQAPRDLEAGIRGILWFYRCGEPASEKKGRAEGGPALFSYQQDGGLIYAAFLEQYSIDLTEAELHWWKFRALFEGLRQDCLFRQVVGWRATPLSDKMTKEERALLRARKALYRLPDHRSQDQRQADFDAAMAEGF